MSENGGSEQGKISLCIYMHAPHNLLVVLSNRKQIHQDRKHWHCAPSMLQSLRAASPAEVYCSSSTCVTLMLCQEHCRGLALRGVTARRGGLVRLEPPVEGFSPPRPLPLFGGVPPHPVGVFVRPSWRCAAKGCSPLPSSGCSPPAAAMCGWSRLSRVFPFPLLGVSLAVALCGPCR